jgi:hypothetical protein
LPSKKGAAAREIVEIKLEKTVMVRKKASRLITFLLVLF